MNIIEVWHKYLFDHIPDKDRDIPLTEEILKDPTHPVPSLLTYLYTLDLFLFQELNKGSKEGDMAKVDTLGPYAAAFGEVITYAAMKRTDLDTNLKQKIEKDGILLYRGTGLKPVQLKEYQDLVGETEVRKVPNFTTFEFEEKELPKLMTLTGFISTSLDKLAAEQFAWSNSDTGHEATLFQIMWKYNMGYYVMDMSAFPEEKEILLYDGSEFEVVSVEKTVDQYGSPLNLVILKE